MMICKKPAMTVGPCRLTERRNAVNVSEGTTMITTARSAAKAGTPRRVRRQTIGLLAAQSERFDFKTPCRKCGNTPTQLVCRGPIIIERTCHNCGDVEFLDAPSVARQGAGSHLRRNSSLANISVECPNPCAQQNQSGIIPHVQPSQTGAATTGSNNEVDATDARVQTEARCLTITGEVSISTAPKRFGGHPHVARSRTATRR